MYRMNQEAKNGAGDDYKRQIIDMVGKIENLTILKKIYTVVKTYLLIIREEEQGD